MLCHGSDAQLCTFACIETFTTFTFNFVVRAQWDHGFTRKSSFYLQLLSSVPAGCVDRKRKKNRTFSCHCHELGEHQFNAHPCLSLCMCECKRIVEWIENGSKGNVSQQAVIFHWVNGFRFFANQLLSSPHRNGITVRCWTLFQLLRKFCLTPFPLPFFSLFLRAHSCTFSLLFDCCGCSLFLCESHSFLPWSWAAVVHSTSVLKEAKKSRSQQKHFDRQGFWNDCMPFLFSASGYFCCLQIENGAKICASLREKWWKNVKEKEISLCSQVELKRTENRWMRFK